MIRERGPQAHCSPRLNTDRAPHCFAQSRSPAAAAQALALARLTGPRRQLEDLTPRKFDVLCMLVSPAAVREIAQRLHL